MISRFVNVLQNDLYTLHFKFLFPGLWLVWLVLSTTLYLICICVAIKTVLIWLISECWRTVKTNRSRNLCCWWTQMNRRRNVASWSHELSLMCVCVCVRACVCLLNDWGVWVHWPDTPKQITWSNALQNRCYICIQWTHVLYSVVKTWKSNPPISQFKRPCNECMSVCQCLYTAIRYSLRHPLLRYPKLQVEGYMCGSV